MARAQRLAFTVLLLLGPLAAPGGERELWMVWQRHMASPDDHAGVVDACRGYAATLPQDTFLPVIHGIEAWHLLRAGRAAEGIRVLTPYLNRAESPLEKGGQRLARAWVTRLQREWVVDALQAHYRLEICYPQDLDSLPDAESLPRTDAWGTPWRYRLTGFQDVPGFRDQKYKLESVSIQPPHDVAAALAVPYGDRMVARPVRVPQSQTLLKLETMAPEGTKDAVVSQAGESVDGIYIAHVGRNLVVLCDSLHWKVLPWKP
jgi:hypothetical protein